jgi:hypothetical protein
MIVSELRSAFRTLLQRQPFTCVSVLLLALGVGATTVLFALADAVMFRPFPFADQDRLVIGAENRAGWTRAEVSYASFRDWRARSIAFDGLAAIGSSNWTTTLHGSDPIMVASGGFGYRARRLMVAFEIAVAVVVLTGAGLLYRSVSRLGHLDLGFNPERLLAVEVGLPPTIANGTRADVFSSIVARSTRSPTSRSCRRQRRSLGVRSRDRSDSTHRSRSKANRTQSPNTIRGSTSKQSRQPILRRWAHA